MQLFAGELTNQNREYYKVNDKYMYCSTYCSEILISILYIKNTNKDDHFYIKNTN